MIKVTYTSIHHTPVIIVGEYRTLRGAQIAAGLHLNKLNCRGRDWLTYHFEEV